MNKLLYSAEWMSMYENEQGTNYVQMGDAVIIVPLTTKRQILFIHEHSAAFNEDVLILPSGAVEPNEALANTANRELQEEIGLHAARLDYLGEIRPHAKYLQSRFSVFLARQFSRHKEIGDEINPITIERIPLKQIGASISTGRIQDAPTLAALYLTERFLAKRQRKF